MKIATITKPFVTAFFKTKRFCIKNAPDILIGAGITTGVIGTVVACKQTLKLDAINTEYHTQKARIAAAVETHAKADGSEYSDTDATSDMLTISSRRVLDVVKNYALPAGMLIASTSMILGGYGILKARHAALVAAYGALQTAFSEYRDRVRAKVGEEEEYRLYHNIQEVDTEKTDPETGEVTTEKTYVKGDGAHSPYTRFFDEYSECWTRDADYNKAFLIAKEKELTLKLERDGYLILNDAYRALGLQADKTGQVCGWVYKPNDPNHKGDNYVSFGLYTGEDHRFVNGLEKSILLDFNVDGYIIDQIS